MTEYSEMSSFEEFTKSLKEIKSLLNQSDKSCSFKDVHQEIQSNIDSLKEILIPLDDNLKKMNDDKIEFLDLSIPPLKTYKPLPKMELNIDLVINKLQRMDSDLSENKSRPSKPQRDSSLSSLDTQLSNKHSKQIVNNHQLNSNENEEKTGTVASTDGNMDNIANMSKRQIFKRVKYGSNDEYLGQGPTEIENTQTSDFYADEDSDSSPPPPPETNNFLGKMVIE